MLIDKKIFYKNLIRLALPIALQSLMLAAVAAGDALMLGKVAQDEMTAVSLATQIQFVQNMFLGAITAASVGVVYHSIVLHIYGAYDGVDTSQRAAWYGKCNEFCFYTVSIADSGSVHQF